MVVSMNAPIAAWADTGEESSAVVGSQVAETEPVVPVEEQVTDSSAEPTVESSEIVDVVKTTETPVAFAAGETQNATAVATIDGTAYDTLAAAIAAVPDSGATPTTITLNSDATGGVKINGDKNVILDLNSHTYNVVQGVGSTGTETNGMQLIKGSTVVIKNGTMTASANAGLHFMIKNYGDLTLENVVVQASGLGNGDSTVNNCGNLTVRGANASIAAPQGGYAVTTAPLSRPAPSTACIPREASGKRAVLVRIIAALRFPPRLPAVRSDRSASAIGMRRKILHGRLTWDPMLRLGPSTISQLTWEPVTTQASKTPSRQLNLVIR